MSDTEDRPGAAPEEPVRIPSLVPPARRATERSHFRFCPDCGGPLSRAERQGRLRPVCPACGFVQWRNPVVGVAAVLREEDVVRLLGERKVHAAQWDPMWRPDPGAGRLLLVRRAASRRGGWCLPCGYVEYDEEIRSALTREILEETGLSVETGEVLAVHSNFHDPDRQSVGIWFAARPLAGPLAAGDDAEAIGFFPPGLPPPLAFPTDALVLRSLAGERAPQ